MLTAATRVYVAGHRGLAGSAICRELERRGVRTPITRTHAEVDLESAAATDRFFDETRPEVVFMAAAKVGGILANNTYPADFIVRNLMIQTHVLNAALRTGVRRLVFLGSSCIYPKDCPQPIREDYLLTGPLEPTNRPYALAKIAGVEMCWSFNRQHGTQFIAAMPTNLYGPGDNYDLQNSHVLPALMRKMHDAKESGAPSVTIWGSGTPRREFMHADDLARGLVFLATLDDARFAPLVAAEACPLINVGTGRDETIRELAETIADVVGYRGQFVYDTSKPDGTPRKMLDVSRMRALGFTAAVSLRDGIRSTYDDFLARHVAA